MLQNSKNKDVAIDFLKKIYARDSASIRKYLLTEEQLARLPAQTDLHTKLRIHSLKSVNIHLILRLDKIQVLIMECSLTKQMLQSYVMPDVYSGKISVIEALKRAEEQFINSTK